MDFVLWTRLCGGKLSEIATLFRHETRGDREVGITKW
jgi:hypothetical protein